MRSIGALAAVTAILSLALAPSVGARPDTGPRCAADHDPPTAGTVAEHVRGAHRALGALQRAVAAGDDDAALGALRRYGRESSLATCESKLVDRPPPELATLTTLGDMHVAGLRTFDGVFDRAGDAVKRPLRRAIVHEKRACGEVIRVLLRLAASAPPEKPARSAARARESRAAGGAVVGRAGPGRPPLRPGG